MFTTGPGMIMAPAAYANPDPAAFKPIGAGPFKFESYAPAEKTVVVANEDYFDGRPNLDKIEFVLLGADATAYDSFKSGGIDVAYLRRTEVVDEAITDGVPGRSDEHTSELQSLMRISYAVFCLNKQKILATTTDAEQR